MAIFAKQTAIFLVCDSTGLLTTLQYIMSVRHIEAHSFFAGPCYFKLTQMHGTDASKSNRLTLEYFVHDVN